MSEDNRLITEQIPLLGRQRSWLLKLRETAPEPFDNLISDELRSDLMFSEPGATYAMFFGGFP